MIKCSLLKTNLKFFFHSVAISAALVYSEAKAVDTGAASSHLLPKSSKANPLEEIQRVRIPIFLQSWNEVAATNQDGRTRPARIPAKPLSHVLRARIDKPNDFYVGDWRLQTTPVRWLKQSNFYQVRVDVYRRYGETGQVEESLGSLNLTATLTRQDENIFAIVGSSSRRFNDQNGQPILEVQLGVPASDLRRSDVSSRSSKDKNR